MRETLTLGAVVTFVGVIAVYFIVPRELKSFYTLLAVIGVIVGYPSGKLVSGKLRRFKAKIIALSISGLLCVAFAIAYMALVPIGSANVSDINLAGGMFAAFFFAFSFLMPIAKMNLSSFGGG